MGFVGSPLSVRSRVSGRNHLCQRRLRHALGRGVSKLQVKASIGEDVSAGFIQVCVGPKPYGEAVKDFISAVSDAFSKGYSMTALQLEMQGSAAPGGRQLQGDEVELRSVLITLVYKTLQVLNVDQEKDAPKIEFTPGPFDDFVRQIVAARQRGYDLNMIQQEFNLENTSSTESRSPLESAILRQGTRIVFETVLQVSGDKEQ